MSRATDMEKLQVKNFSAKNVMASSKVKDWMTAAPWNRSVAVGGSLG
jgi:hypothetical protein